MIRIGGYGDYSHMARIHAANFERGWSAEEIRQLIEQSGAKALVYDMAGSRAGFILIRCAADECEILAIAVEEAQKRKGIGIKLLENLEEYARPEGVRKIFLEVAEDNMAAIGLYAAGGYVEMARRKAYYRRWHGRRVDALVMAKML